MRLLAAVTGFALVISLAAAPGASAAWQIGDPCAASQVEPGTTAIVENPGAVQAGRVPSEGPKVITAWRVNAPLGFGPVAQQLVVLRPGSEIESLMTGESAIETVVGGGANEFATRIPFAAGSSIGLRGPNGTLLCNPEPGHVAHLFSGPWALGELRQTRYKADMGVPIVVNLEHDRDGDGFGDETQDRCGDSALWQEPCPIVSLISGPIEVRPGAIVISPALSHNGQVAVGGRVTWDLPPRRLRTGRAVARTRTVRLDGGSHEVLAGVRTTFQVPLPKALRQHLGKLSRDRKQKGKLTIVASGAPELEGRTMAKTLNLRLPGRAKPPH